MVSRETDIRFGFSAENDGNRLLGCIFLSPDARERVPESFLCFRDRQGATCRSRIGRRSARGPWRHTAGCMDRLGTRGSTWLGGAAWAVRAGRPGGRASALCSESSVPRGSFALAVAELLAHQAWSTEPRAGASGCVRGKRWQWGKRMWARRIEALIRRRVHGEHAGARGRVCGCGPRGSVCLAGANHVTPRV